MWVTAERKRRCVCVYVYVFLSWVCAFLVLCCIANHHIKVSLYFPTDPGYRDTARMLVESGMCLALEKEKIRVSVFLCSSFFSSFNFQLPCFLTDCPLTLPYFFPCPYLSVRSSVIFLLDCPFNSLRIPISLAHPSNITFSPTFLPFPPSSPFATDSWGCVHTCFLLGRCAVGAVMQHWICLHAAEWVRV